MFFYLAGGGILISFVQGLSESRSVHTESWREESCLIDYGSQGWLLQNPIANRLVAELNMAREVLPADITS